jgi:hypothetical protein
LTNKRREMLQWIVPVGKKTTIDKIWKRLIEIGVQSKVYLQTWLAACAYFLNNLAAFVAIWSVISDRVALPPRS